MNTIHISPNNTSISVPTGENLPAALRMAGLAQDDIRQVQLAGAFGSFLNPKSACRVGLCRRSCWIKSRPWARPQAAVSYYYGERTIAYTACVLF